jgi:FkbM family methyltransferase
MRNIISKIINALNIDTFKEQILIRLGLRKKLYEQKALSVSKLYKNLLKPRMLVYDIGANQGHYTAGFLLLGAKVISVEPQQNCFRILKARYNNNPNVHLLNLALDNTEGEKKIHISNMNTISSMSEEWISAVKESRRFPNAKWSKDDIVKTSTLEALIGTYGRPDFIKIDVEGYELNVLKGLKSKVPLISIEYTFEVIETAVQCIEYLKGIGEILILFDYCFLSNDKGNWMNNIDAISALRNIKENSAGDLFIKFVF